MREPCDPAGARRDETRRIHLHDDEVEATRSEVLEHRHEPWIDERRQRHDERVRGEDPSRNQADVAPRERRLDPGLEQRLDQAVPLLCTHARPQPPEDAAVADETDTVAALEVPRGERRRGAHRVVECAARLAAQIDEAVDEDDDVGVALGMALVDDEGLTPRRRAPVDRADPIACDEVTKVCVLDPVAGVPRHLVAGERLRLAGGDQALDGLQPRIRLQRQPLVEALLPRDDAKDIGRAQLDPPDVEDTPMRAAEHERHDSFLPRLEPQAEGALAVGYVEAVGQVEDDLEPSDR